MKNNRVHIFIFLILGSVFVTSSLHSKRGGKQKEKQLANEILQQACTYLSSKQLSDGSWRSDEYGLLKSGQSLTPFILDAYLDTPFQKSHKHNQLIEKSINFLRQKNNHGVHGKCDPDFLDYPNYSTSYALRCFLKFGQEKDDEKIKKMIQYLQDQQFSEKYGFDLNSPPYGGWGFGINQKPTLGSFVDLAHTRRVLQSLNHANAITNQIKNRSEYFLNRLQKRKQAPNNYRTNWIPKYGYDGGFFSSPTIAYANKGRTRIDQNSGQEYFRSYSTATCDGVLSIIALGYQSSSQEIKDAKLWLKQNQDWELPSGVPRDDPSPWAESMKLYNLMVLSETYCALKIPGNWQNKIINFLAERQRPDGSFRNMKGRLMKEDDPLISTTYAIIALNHILTSS